MAENKQNTNTKPIDPYMESMVLYQKIYDFLKYIYPVLAQFPKFEKFALQTQIKTSYLKCQKALSVSERPGQKATFIMRMWNCSL